MPPRKRARVSQATSPTPTSQPKTPTPADSSPSKPEEQILTDPWTDEEEIGLFKGLMRYKPTGIHKHFHLISLHKFMLEGGYIHPRNEHTKPEGIWRKLQSLYNLDALDEREDARQLEKVVIPESFRQSDDEMESNVDDDADVYSEAANKIENEDFDLPGQEFAEMKWARRLASEKQRKDESPFLLSEVNLANESPMRFTPSFSIEPSEGATPVSRRGRPKGGTAGGRGRAAASATTTSTRRSMRQAESVADEEEGGQEEHEAEDDSSEEEPQSEQSTPVARSTRNAKGARGRPAGRNRGRGRR